MTTEPTTITLAEIEPFKQFCADNGVKVRLSTAMGAINKPDFEVRTGGHWMGVRYNKLRGTLTVDKRMVAVVERFRSPS